MKITAKTIMGDILKINPKAADILMSRGMGCIGCPSSQMEALEDAALIHGLDVNELLEELNKDLE
ncbi:DUF1858 domain-containing protein [Clostridium hydrogeniformans]|uniref:DUF1858 domain-containing protein n=1 Tax=Clostridium hydrogeniformans TaxID=349933 RepID=UPI000480F76E|nr:DUF1858 domain-containing protein [Clostridium hydrogeniformans]